MPYGYLLEDDSGRYQLEDGSGVYLKDVSLTVSAYKFRTIIRDSSTTVKMGIFTGTGTESNYVRSAFNEQIERIYAGNLTDAQIRTNLNAELNTWADANSYTQADWQT